MFGLLCLSHLSEMLFRVRVAVTTLRSVCMVLIALRACRLSEAMTEKNLQLTAALSSPLPSYSLDRG